MESASHGVPFPLLADPATYSPCTIDLHPEGDREAKKTLKMWLDIFRKSIESFKARAASDASVDDASSRAEKFATRYGEILDDFEADPSSHGGPPDAVMLTRLRDVVLREVGFVDIFQKVKAEENEKALALLPTVLAEIDAVSEKKGRLEMTVKGVLAGNLFDLGAAIAQEQVEGGVDFAESLSKLLPRPWVLDDMDALLERLTSDTKYEKAVIFVDNSGADVVLGVLPLARELLQCGTKVVLAANDMPTINDVTYLELGELLTKVDDERLQMALDSGSLLVVNSGSDLPVLDLSSVSPELAWVAEDADLVIFEGMGRGIETNLNAKLKVDKINIGMVKHQEVADHLKGRLYDCVVKYSVRSTPPAPQPKVYNRMYSLS